MGVLEFDHFSAIDADEVVVGGAVDEVGVVVFLAIAEVDLVNEIGLIEESKGAVDGGTGRFGTRKTQPVEEFIGCEVLIRGKNDLYDFIALGCLTQSLFADELVESLSNVLIHGITPDYTDF